MKNKKTLLYSLLGLLVIVALGVGYYSNSGGLFKGAITNISPTTTTTISPQINDTTFSQYLNISYDPDYTFAKYNVYPNPKTDLKFKLKPIFITSGKEVTITSLSIRAYVDCNDTGEYTKNTAPSTSCPIPNTTTSEPAVSVVNKIFKNYYISKKDLPNEVLSYPFNYPTTGGSESDINLIGANLKIPANTKTQIDLRADIEIPANASYKNERFKFEVIGVTAKFTDGTQIISNFPLNFSTQDKGNHLKFYYFNPNQI